MMVEQMMRKLVMRMFEHLQMMVVDLKLLVAVVVVVVIAVVEVVEMIEIQDNVVEFVVVVVVVVDSLLLPYNMMY